MSEALARLALGVYRLAGTLASPLARPYVGWRVSRGKEEAGRRRERHGVAGIARPASAPLVWIHAASIGESAAVAPLARALADEGLTVLMTTGTVTSAGVVVERLGAAVIHQYAPLDLHPAITRFLDHWRPDLVLVAESEIWPTTMGELSRRGIPQLLVNGRLSDRSFRRWQKAPAIARAVLGNLAHVIAQSQTDATRFRALGARSVGVAGNLKADTVLAAPDPLALATMRDRLGTRPAWAAISTHEGEEAMAGQVHSRLAARHPGLMTIVVPRHVERGEAIARDLSTTGLSVARRSLGQEPGLATDILIGDTIGEMGLYLALAEIAFVGKSLYGTGGQNPLEAAMAEAAILSGPHVENFRDIYQSLEAAGGARIVTTGDEVADEVARLLDDAAARHAMIAAARDAVAEMQGGLPRTLEALQPFLRPLRSAVQGRARSEAVAR